VHEAGVKAIRAYSQRLTAKLCEDVLAAGFTINSPSDPQRRGGTLTVGLRPEEDGPAFVRALEARGVLVDHRPKAGIRVSPHFYTLEDELSEFVELLVELRNKGKWKDYLNQKTAY
jgi:kynureninase